MRGHGNSGGKVGMAWLDRFDVSRWVDMLISKYGKSVQIALFGVSMGGSAVVAAAGMTPPTQVKCVVSDCGFSSQADEYAHEMRKYILKPIVKFAFNSGVKLVHGYTPAHANIDALANNITVPALFVHGSADRVVPFEQGQKLFDACGSKHKTLLAVENADHTFACAVDPDKYTAALDQLIDKCFEGVDPRPEKPAEPEKPVEPEKPAEPEKPVEQENTASEGVAEEKSSDDLDD